MPSERPRFHCRADFDHGTHRIWDNNSILQSREVYYSSVPACESTRGHLQSLVNYSFRGPGRCEGGTSLLCKSGSTGSKPCPGIV